MLIEFIGAAGVGKSFHAAKLRQSLVARGLAAQRLDSIRIRRSSPANLLTMARATIIAHHTGPRTIWTYRRNLKFIGQYACHRRLCNNIPGAFIASEGLFHQSIVMSRQSTGLSVKAIVLAFYASIEPPDVVIIVAADAATIQERRTQRMRPNDSFTMDSIRDDIAMADEAFEAVSVVQERLAVDILRLRIDTYSALDVPNDDQVDAILQCAKTVARG